MENSEICGHLWDRAEPILLKNDPFSMKIAKNGSARPQRWPHISEFSILWGHESLHTLFQHYKLRLQSKNLAKWRWKILSYRALKFLVVLFYILGIFTSIVSNCMMWCYLDQKPRSFIASCSEIILCRPFVSYHKLLNDVRSFWLSNSIFDDSLNYPWIILFLDGCLVIYLYEEM